MPLKSFIAEVAGAEALVRSFGEEDYRLAAVALLFHVANVDGQTDLAERRRLKTIIEERFGIDAKAASELITMGEQSDREAVDFYHFTSVVNARSTAMDARKSWRCCGTSHLPMAWSMNSRKTRSGTSPNF